jgi:hypothetical protein
VLTKRTADETPVHNFQSLLVDLATLTINRVQPANKSVPAFNKLTNPTALQQRALDLLGVRVVPPAT